MASRPLQFLRRLLAGLQKNRTDAGITRRRTKLVLEVLEERVTPTAGVQEQYMLDLVNRFRQNPAAELSLILGANDPNITNSLQFYGVDENALAAQWAMLTPAPPLAWNDSLASAALAHSQVMLQYQQQTHQVTNPPNVEADPFTRMVNAGYTNYTFLAENIFAYASSVFEAEASFAIDWGNNPPTGIQSPPGHRDNLMDADLREIGIGLVDAPAGSPMGPLLVTQDFGNRTTIGNPFLLGNVYDDLNQDGFYEPGEGLSSVNLAITGPAGTFQATTSAAGGYQLQVPAGTYQITASGGGLAAPVTKSVTVGSVNVQVDITPPEVTAPTMNGPAASTTSTTPTFSWTAPSGATKYALQVTNVTTGAQVISASNLTTTSYTPATPLHAGSYQATVTASNGTGQTSPASAPDNFTIAPPAIPTFTAPSAAPGTSTPTFSWTASAGADHYDLWANNVTTGQMQIIRQQTLTTTSFTPGTALPVGSYTAWVQAFNNTGDSAGWSAALNFAIGGPAVPAMTGPTGSPVNGFPTLTWTGTGAAHYDLWVDDETTGQSQIIRQQSLTTTSFTPATALPVGTYMAWVEALDSANNASPWSAGLSFTVSGPPVPTMTAPTGSSVSGSPSFTWTASSGAVRYDLWVDNHTTGQSQIIRQQNLTTTSFTPASPLPYGNYAAWVEAFDSSNNASPWSAELDFTITAPAAPTLTGPAADITSTTPTFTWSASAGATQYDVWADNATTGQSQVVRATVATNSYTPASAIPRGQYTFWVRAGNGSDQFGNWSAGYNFLIDSNAPAISTFTGPGSPTSNLMPTITWSASTGAAYYDLWVDNATTGQSQVIRQQTLATNSFTPATPLTVGTYVAWVDAYDSTNEARGWSAAFQFTITAPGVPSPTGPTSSTTNTMPTFAWGAVANAATYDLWVDDVTSGQSQVIRQMALTAPSFTPATALNPGSYRFWVRALNANGDASAWSGEVDFTIV